MIKKKKFASESLVVRTELVLPNDTNTLNDLMGGRLMHWMDIVSAISAMKHCNSQVVTASVDNVSFAHSIRLGNVVTMSAKVTRAFNTSMEVYIEVIAEDIKTGKKLESNKAYFTFVSLDTDGKPLPVPELVPETKEEEDMYAGALQRRQLRLILAKRMKPEDANELRAIFELGTKR